ncbi:16S rRNA (cytosine(967)-C(5))-methyltransferase RsmB [Paraburkholderia kururiensis]|uniref:16S rRNA (cytosine(967)-C(5))-methyltransferase RsmB n=1 Tax=Paraburkholderia kururiensis TaxID=984307 RepID=UPI0009D94FD3|nr:16S rRNA (cytosine(967)-C(5))-methyltransferase RsmB [Paraburkholderia kururiensis]
MTSKPSRRPPADHKARSRPSRPAQSGQGHPVRRAHAPQSGRSPQHREPRLSALHLAPDSLGFALDCAAQAVTAVRGGAALPAALAAVSGSLPASAVSLARGATQDIAYRTMRCLATVDRVIALRVHKAPPAHVTNMLACALALLCDENEPPSYATFTVVDQAVNAVGARREVNFAKGLVNAVLRGFLRERDTLLAEVRQDEVARWNYPQWWIDATRRAWPDAWQDILAAGNDHGPLTLRVNARRSNVADYLALLREQHIDATQSGEQAVTLAVPTPVDRIPGFASGVVSVQDAGAQLAARSLDVRDGMRVLDACAAPGGKTGHLLEHADIDLVALESDPARAPRIAENLQRLGLDADIRVGDAGEPSQWHDGQPFDRILADVPCSASGIVRRHPDIRWLRRASDIEALVAEQRRILQALWPLVKTGGELLYVTCSIFPEEGELQARWFESFHQDAVRLDAPGQLLPTAHRASAEARGGSGTAAEASRAAAVSEHNANHDGFFYARFQKR